MAIIKINHGEEFMTGIRLILRCGRNKDGGARRPSRAVAARNLPEFSAKLTQLIDDLLPGERVYASVDERLFGVATRLFKERVLTIDYSGAREQEKFYFDLNKVWESCLGSPTARATKYFLFDLDSPEESALFDKTWPGVSSSPGTPTILDDYPTKNGRHVVTTPFNPALLPALLQSKVQKNAMILWAYAT